MRSVSFILSNFYPSFFSVRVFEPVERRLPLVIILFIPDFSYPYGASIYPYRIYIGIIYARINHPWLFSIPGFLFFLVCFGPPVYLLRFPVIVRPVNVNVSRVSVDTLVNDEPVRMIVLDTVCADY